MKRAKMTPLLVNLSQDQHQQLAQVREEMGIPASEQVRRAIALWMSQHQQREDQRNATTHD